MVREERWIEAPWMRLQAFGRYGYWWYVLRAMLKTGAVLSTIFAAMTLVSVIRMEPFTWKLIDTLYVVTAGLLGMCARGSTELFERTVVVSRGVLVVDHWPHRWIWQITPEVEVRVVPVNETLARMEIRGLVYPKPLFRLCRRQLMFGVPLEQAERIKQMIGIGDSGENAAYNPLSQ